ncbi:alpha-crystallin A chain [Agrilus planipennis]|uniref:Alpha-crystallin A chain n=1 Tax=Agrilus planipennis TaxID=224129 RepID=A0A1W4XC01_AGRPL|nr:alpha-crystallin A chain [Agrilus planipennis]
MSIIPLIWTDRLGYHPSRLLGQQFGMEVDDDDIFPPITAITRSLLNTPQVLPQSRSNYEPIKADEDKFQVNVDVQQFAPDEITVKVDDDKNTITVEGKHEEKPDEHGYISRHFVRRYVIPEGHDMKNIQSNLSSDGVLTIAAPKINQEDKDSRVIPIQQTGRPFKNKKFKNKKFAASRVGKQNTPVKRNPRHK